MTAPFPSLANQLLIAMPNMQDGRFQKTVTLLCEHNTAGAMGIVINHPLNLKLSDILKASSINEAHEDAAVNINQAIYSGGPVQQERGFVLHTPAGKWESSLAVSKHISMTTSKDIIGGILQGNGPEKTLIAIGYAGWQAGQLEVEIKANIWLTAPADSRIIFDIPMEKRWQAAAEKTGINITALTFPAGHA